MRVPAASTFSVPCHKHIQAGCMPSLPCIHVTAISNVYPGNPSGAPRRVLTPRRHQHSTHSPRRKVFRALLTLQRDRPWRAGERALLCERAQPARLQVALWQARHVATDRAQRRARGFLRGRRILRVGFDDHTVPYARFDGRGERVHASTAWQEKRTEHRVY